MTIVARSIDVGCLFGRVVDRAKPWTHAVFALSTILAALIAGACSSSGRAGSSESERGPPPVEAPKAQTSTSAGSGGSDSKGDGALPEEGLDSAGPREVPPGGALSTRAAASTIATSTGAPTVADSRGDRDPSRWTAPGTPPRKHQRVISDGADPGRRDVDEITSALRAFVRSQPYGQRWTARVPRSPPATDQRGLGTAKSFEPLSRDPMELQSQVQYVEDSDTNLRYGHVSVRAQRVFRHGRLFATRILCERIPGSSDDEYLRDLIELSNALSADPGKLGMPDGFRVTRDDFAGLRASPGGAGAGAEAGDGSRDRTKDLPSPKEVQPKESVRAAAKLRHFVLDIAPKKAGKRVKRGGP